METFSSSQLALAPLGAGDLIDRALRLYRRHLFVLVRIAAPPVIIVAAGWMLLSISVRQIFIVAGTGELFWHILLMIAALGIMTGGYLLVIIVMGGATRTLVAHLLRNDPVTARATYAAVKARFWGLALASLIVLIWISASSAGAFIGFEMVFGISFFIVGLVAMVAPWWFAAILGVIGFLLATGSAMWLFFFVVGRVAYVPQVMLVEGKGVFDAMGRSFALAKGNVRRLMAMTLFTTFATISALMLLLCLFTSSARLAASMRQIQPSGRRGIRAPTA
jgi:hypothetical protein